MVALPPKNTKSQLSTTRCLHGLSCNSTSNRVRCLRSVMENERGFAVLGIARPRTSQRAASPIGKAAAR